MIILDNSIFSLALLHKTKSMKKYLPIFIVLFLFVASCTSTKDSINQTNHKKIITAVIKFIPDSIYFFNTRWMITGTNISADFFEEQLTANLDNYFLNSKKRISFYTENEIHKYNITPDWVIYLKFTELNISDPRHHVATVSPSLSSSADNTTIYVMPPFGAMTGTEPSHPTTYAPYDLVAYTASIPAQSVSQYTVNTHAILGFNIVEEKNSNDLSVQSFKANYLLVRNDLNQDGDKTTASLSAEEDLIAIMQKLYDKIYPKIVDNINAALN